MIALLGAMDGEIDEFLSHIDARRVDEWYGYRFHIGQISGHQVLVGKSGVGKSLSAMMTQHIVERYEPREIIFTGIAGALDPELEIGDTVVGVDCMQYDMDATALGFALGEVPYTPYRILNADERLVRQCEPVVPLRPDGGTGRVVKGRVVTGDRFVSGKDAQLVRFLREELGGSVVEMEGASVGLVATVNRVPFLLIRTVSDRADGRAPGDFQAFLTQASQTSWRFVDAMLQAAQSQ